MDPEVELNEANDIGDLVVGELERPHPGLGHLCPDEVVVTEAHRTVDVGTGLRLAHVVEERSETEDVVSVVGLVDDRQGVGEDVLVAMDRILLQLQTRQLWEEVLGEAGVDEESEPGCRGRHGEQFTQLISNALGRHDGQPLVVPLHRGDELGIWGEVEPGEEACGAQHAQRVVFEADRRVEWRPQALGEEVEAAVVGVDEFVVGQANGHGVDGEVTSGEIALNVVAEGHDGLSRIRFVGIGPERRDLEGHPIDPAANGPELSPLIPD